MSFAHPLALLALLILPVALAGYIAAQRHRDRYAVRFTNLDLLANVVGTRPAWRRHVPSALYLLGLGALLIALSRPQFDVSVPRDGTVVLVTDISGSMNATDIQPTRLGAAQAAAKTLVSELPDGFRVALVSFSNTAQTRLTPTNDRKAVSAALDGLVPNGGTAIGDGILAALDAIKKDAQTTAASGATPTPTPSGSATAKSNAVIVLLSDGASNSGVDLLDAAAQAKDANVPIFTIALGTPDGVAEVKDNLGRLRRVAVPPDPDTLRAVSETTGAESFDAPTAEQLKAIYRNLGDAIGHDTESRDMTVGFLIAGMLAVAVAGGFSLFWFNRFP